MSAFRAFLLCLGCVCLAGCITLSRQAKDQNIRTAPDAKSVEGMTMVKSWTTRGGFGWGPSDIASKVANNMAKQEGYSNTVVLIELVDPGQAVKGNEYGRGAIWKVSVYRPQGDQPAR